MTKDFTLRITPFNKEKQQQQKNKDINKNSKPKQKINYISNKQTTQNKWRDKRK